MSQTINLWFIKSRRAQNVEDFETWLEGGVVPTLNVFDNTGDTRATILIIDGTRVNDVRVYDDEIMQTVIQRWGTGGGNVPAIFPIQDGREINKKQNGIGIGNKNDPSYTLDTTGGQAIAHQTVRRLTPLECERLQGFPDNWTQFDEKGKLQSDSARYKQMGNAVAVPVVSWIAQRLAEINNARNEQNLKGIK